jgi:N-acetylglutamate synthase
MHDDQSIDVIRQVEERLINVWPAPSTMLMDGWIVRFANGYSGRANSASAVLPEARMSEALITQIEQIYRAAALSPTVRITPLAHATTEPMLLARGYRIKDEASMMVADFDCFQHHRIDPRVTIKTTPDQDWVEGISVRQEPSKRSPDHLRAIVGQLRVTGGFATLESEGEKLGFGMAAIDRDWAELGSIMLDRHHRGKGLGRALVTSMLAWAAQKDAERAFLQVVVTNSVAVRLYESLGFKELCRYRTLTLQ